jgi:hypothetical protein
MARPEMQALLTAQQRAAIEARYSPLFRNLNLSPEQTAKLTALLADRGNTRRDVDEAARAQGIDPRQNPEAFRQLLSDAQGVLDSGIKAVIGDSGFTQLTSFERTLPQRNLVDQLQQRLVHTNVPLTPAQTEQLVQIFATHSPAPTRPAAAPGAGGPPADRMVFEFRPGGGPGFGPPPGGPDLGRVVAGAVDMPIAGLSPGGPGPVAVVTPAAVAQAQTVLVPQQLEALQKIQQTQAAQQQVQQMIRQTIATATQAAGGSAPAAGTSATGSGTPSAPPPPRKGPGGG